LYNLILTENSLKLKLVFSWTSMAHACNPSHSGGRDQEDRGLKSAGETLSRKTLHKNRVGEVAQGEGPEFKPSTGRKKKKTKKPKIHLLEKNNCKQPPCPTSPGCRCHERGGQW
jgi:hypothetical protein